jgi:hypothetical protein
MDTAVAVADAPQAAGLAADDAAMLRSLPDALRAVLGKGFAAVQREPNGGELYAALQAGAADELALLEADGVLDSDAARLSALAGELFSGPRLAALIRSGVAQTFEAALGHPQLWLLACRALKHIPAWVLETAEERSARLAAEHAGKAGRGRPGKPRAEPAAESGAPGDSAPSAEQPYPPAAALVRAWEKIPLDRALRPRRCPPGEWTSPEFEREQAEIAELWRGHDPLLADQVNVRRYGVAHYLTLCRTLDPQDIAVLDRDLLPPAGHDLSGLTRAALIPRAKRLWRLVAQGTWPQDRPLYGPRSRLITREAAQQRLEELRFVDENG